MIICVVVSSQCRGCSCGTHAGVLFLELAYKDLSEVDEADDYGVSAEDPQHEEMTYHSSASSHRYRLRLRRVRLAVTSRLGLAWTHRCLSQMRVSLNTPHTMSLRTSDMLLPPHHPSIIHQSIHHQQIPQAELEFT